MSAREAFEVPRGRQASERTARELLPWPLLVVLVLVAVVGSYCSYGPTLSDANRHPGGAPDYVPGAPVAPPSPVASGVPLPSAAAAPTTSAPVTVAPSARVGAVTSGHPMGSGWFGLGPTVRVSVPGARVQVGHLLVDVRVFNDGAGTFAASSMAVDVPLTTGGGSPCALAATDKDGRPVLVVELPPRSGASLTYRCPVTAGTTATVELRLYGRDAVSFTGSVVTVADTSGPGQPVSAPPESAFPETDLPDSAAPVTGASASP